MGRRWHRQAGVSPGQVDSSCRPYADNYRQVAGPAGQMTHRDPGFHHQAGSGFRADGVLVDSPHFHACRDALQDLMDT